jgi:hypothetical protein
MFIQRDYTRSLNDDWKLNVQPKMGEYECSEHVYLDDGTICGWKIKPLYE